MDNLEASFYNMSSPLGVITLYYFEERRDKQRVHPLETNFTPGTPKLKTGLKIYFFKPKNPNL
jgi:hypothetical protein